MIAPYLWGSVAFMHVGPHSLPICMRKKSPRAKDTWPRTEVDVTSVRSAPGACWALLLSKPTRLAESLAYVTRGRYRGRKGGQQSACKDSRDKLLALHGRGQLAVSTEGLVGYSASSGSLESSGKRRSSSSLDIIHEDAELHTGSSPASTASSSSGSVCGQDDSWFYVEYERGFSFCSVKTLSNVAVARKSGSSSHWEEEEEDDVASQCVGPSTTTSRPRRRRWFQRC